MNEDHLMKSLDELIKEERAQKKGGGGRGGNRGGFPGIQHKGIHKNKHFEKDKRSFHHNQV